MAEWREACASFRGYIAANGEAKGRGETFFFCILCFRVTDIPPFLDEWAFWRGEQGEILDECIEHPNDTVSFILLNLEDDF